jgi:TonB dependent receptor/TonB-dependent Receptor Plug Domain/Gram-negative bacterial TonB protein C-terminal
MLELHVDAVGRVTAARVVQGQPPFAEAARQAALGWVFTPALRGAQPMAARIRFLVTFEETLTPGEPSTEPASPATARSSEPPSIDVVVTGERLLGGQRITRSEVRQLPGAFGDPFRAIESMPGVTPTLSGAPYFYVRGSPPGNLGLFLDEIRLPTLYHVFAGPPVIHPAMVDEVEFYPGPYPARFGRATGGIAAAHSRPETHELHGEASVRAFDSSGMVELPLGDLPASLTLGGRLSYANPIAHLFAPDIFVGYWDYQAKLSANVAQGQRVTLFTFGAADTLERHDGDEVFSVIDSEFHRVDARYDRELETGSASLATTFGLDRSAANQGRAELQARLVSVRGELRHALSDKATLISGADVGSTRYRAELERYDEVSEREDFERQFQSRVETVVGAHLAVQWAVARRVRLEPGLRADVLSAGEDTALALDPRLSAQYDVTDALTLEHALGVSHQPPGNPLPQPGATPTLGDGLQTALQSSAGFRLTLPLELSLRMTFFQAVMLNLTDGPGVSRLDNANEETTELTRSLGSARGVELLFARSFSKKFAGFVAYTLSSSRRSLDRAEGPALFDRRHVLSGALGYRFGWGYSLGFRGAFYTGVPADVAYLEAAENPPRTTPFYRLDVRAEKRWNIGSNGAYWALVLEVLNATLHTEVLAKSCNAYVCREDEVGPVAVPSLGLEASF